MQDGRTLERRRERPLEVGRVGQAASPERGSLTPPLAPCCDMSPARSAAQSAALSSNPAVTQRLVLQRVVGDVRFQNRPVLNVLRTNGLTENEGADRDLALRPLHRPSAVSADGFVSRAEKPRGQNRFLSLSPFCPLRPQRR